MAKSHPKGLIVLALSNMGERFGYYTMLAILTLYLQAKFGFSSATTSLIYGVFLGLVYFLPVFGGVVADKWLGYGKTVFFGVFIMFIGYLILGLPLGSAEFGIAVMFLSLLLISLGTGLFKGNLQALIGKLYDDPRYSSKRDIAFSIFYMFINIGAFFAPSMGNAITNTILSQEGYYYDAAIPSNYVRLNDAVVDPVKFTSEVQAQHPEWATLDGKAQVELIKKAKKKSGVMFPEDESSVYFNLLLAGLHQFTEAGKIDKNSTAAITKEDYAVMASRLPEDKATQDAIRARVLSAEVPAGLISNATYNDSKEFAKKFGENYVASTLSKSYSIAFFVACASLIFSILIFLGFRRTWKYADVTAKEAATKAKESGSAVVEMSKHEERQRLIALGLVFVVVIFFWMSFHQNGLTMTFFARDYTQSKLSALGYIPFSLLMLIPFACFVYGIYLSTFGLLGGKRNPKTGILLIILGILGLAGSYLWDIKEIGDKLMGITPQIFQQFNPYFIIILTPITVGIFTYLSKKGKEPSAPRKIGIGMVLAALGFLVLLIGSIALPAPSSLDGPSTTLVSPNWLIGTYFVLTLAELFLSPMGLSFVSKVSPPKYSGLMQGGWLAATAVGNFLVGVLGSFWDKLPLVAFWGVLIACCLLSAIFIFSIMKKLEAVTENN